MYRPVCFASCPGGVKFPVSLAKVIAVHLLAVNFAATADSCSLKCLNLILVIYICSRLAAAVKIEKRPPAIRKRIADDLYVRCKLQDILCCKH